MINGRRSDIDILTDILKLGSEKTKKTWILYQANLSYNQLEKYLNLLIDKDMMVQHSSPNKAFQTSEKGHEFLDLVEKINKLLD